METEELEYGTYTVRLRDRGQITIPKNIRENLTARSGDLLTLVQIGDVYFLTKKELQVPKLADKIAAEMERSGITLADLLEGLEEERKAIWEERQRHAA